MGNPNPSRIILIIIALVGTLADGMIGGLTLLSIFGATNLISQIAVFVGGFIITGLAMTTRYALAKESPVILKLLWTVSVVIDAATTIYGIIYFMIPPTVSNPFGIFLAFGLMIAITGSSIMLLYLIDQAE